MHQITSVRLAGLVTWFGKLLPVRLQTWAFEVRRRKRAGDSLRNWEAFTHLCNRIVRPNDPEGKKSEALAVWAAVGLLKAKYEFLTSAEVEQIRELAGRAPE